MSLFIKILSFWLWGGIFTFICFFFMTKEEREAVEFESIHLCFIFILFSFVGLPMGISIILSKSEDDEVDEEESFKERVEDLQDIKNRIDHILMIFRKY